MLTYLLYHFLLKVSTRNVLAPLTLAGSKHRFTPAGMKAIWMDTRQASLFRLKKWGRVILPAALTTLSSASL